MTMQFTRQVQIGVELESSEGVAETLVAADYALNPKGQASYDPDTQRTDREILRPSLSMNTMVPGHRGLTITGVAELAGGTLVAPPVWHDILQGMGFSKGDVDFIVIGTVTNGPFRAGQIIGNHLTLGSATATGRVLMEHLDGSTRRLFYIPLTGTFGSSGTVANYQSTQASATISAGPADGGFFFAPVSQTSSVTPPSVTAGFNDGEQRWKTAGARASGSMRFAVGETNQIEFSIQGPNVLDLTRNPVGPELGGFVSNVSYPSPPPGVLAIRMAMRYGTGAYFTPTLPEVVLQINNTIAVRPTITDNAIASSGRMPALITAREIGLQIEPEADVDNFDIIANDFEAVTFEVGLVTNAPTVSGGAIGCWIPAAHTTGNMSPGDRDGIRTTAPSIRATGNSDDEIIIFHLMIA